MSRVMVPSSATASLRRTMQQTDTLGRQQNSHQIRDFATTGLTSAQIDVLVFGSAQPYDGIQVVDSAANLLITRAAGHWRKITMTTIT